MTDLTGAVWRKSTRSGDNGGDCVEVATNLPGIVAVRDSKDPIGATLAFTPSAWSTFVAAATTHPTGRSHSVGVGPRSSADATGLAIELPVL